MIKYAASAKAMMAAQILVLLTVLSLAGYAFVQAFTGPSSKRCMHHVILIIVITSYFCFNIKYIKVFINKEHVMDLYFTFASR